MIVYFISNNMNISCKPDTFDTLTLYSQSAVHAPLHQQYTAQ